MKSNPNLYIVVRGDRVLMQTDNLREARDYARNNAFAEIEKEFKVYTLNSKFVAQTVVKEQCTKR
jgi:hypothetical protein